jgi:dipicolinate synthase subunit A
VKFAVVGGDRRLELLSVMLHRDGHRVYTYALEKAELPSEIPKAGCLQGCVYGADCVILPTPAEKGGLLNAPLSDAELKMKDVIEALWPGQLLCGGRFSDESCAAALRAKLRPGDLMCMPFFTAGNAALTAEGAVLRLLESSDKALLSSSVLILGWGRIGKILAMRLRALGACVSVAARSAPDRAMAEALGFDVLEYSELEAELCRFDFIVNTVPARVLTDPMLCMAAEDTLLLELASPPGGFDAQLAENIGLRVIKAPGLPGKCSPLSAAAIMKDAVYRFISEQEE